MTGTGMTGAGTAGTGARAGTAARRRILKYWHDRNFFYTHKTLADIIFTCSKLLHTQKYAPPIFLHAIKFDTLFFTQNSTNFFLRTQNFCIRKISTLTEHSTNYFLRKIRTTKISTRQKMRQIIFYAPPIFLHAIKYVKLFFTQNFYTDRKIRQTIFTQ